MKQSRFIRIICVIIALLVFSACANIDDNIYSGDGNQSVDAGEENKKTPKFYYLSSFENGALGEIFSDEDFAKADEYMFDGYSKKIVDDEKVNSTKTIEGIGTFVYKDSKIIQSDPDSKEAVTPG